MEEQMQSAPAPAAAPKNDVESNKIVAAIGYIGILCLVPILFAKTSPFAKHHGKNGLVLFIAEIACAVIFSILTGMFGAFLDSSTFFMIASLLGLAQMALSILWFVLSIMGIIKAVQGQMWEMPLLGGFAKKFKF